MKPFSQTKPLPPGVMARAKARGLRRLAGMVSDEDRDAAEAAVALSDAERAAVAASRMADFESKRPGQKMFAGVRGRVASAGAALAGIKTKVLGMLGLSASPAASPAAPAVTSTPSASWDKLVVSADSSPAEVESCLAAMLAKPSANESQASIHGRLDVFSKFLAEVGKIDASGKIIEAVDGSDPDEARKAARVIGKILGELLPGGRAQGTGASVKPAASYTPRGYDGIQSDIAREIAGQTRPAPPQRATVTPSKPSAPAPVKPAPVQGGSLSSRLTGSAKAEAQIREGMGLPEKPEHVALADKLSNQNSK